MLAVLGAVLLFASPLWADCLGDYRDTTVAEKAAWDRVSQAFPELVRVPAEYVLKKSEISVSRKGRCIDGDNDPIYLPVHMRFELQGEAQRKLKEELDSLQEEKLAVIKKYQPQFAPLQAELGKLFSAGQVTDETLQESQSINQKVNSLIQEQEQELAPYETRMKQLMAKVNIRVDAYFNDKTSECRGKPTELSGVTTACIEHFEDGSALLTVLLGPWRKDEFDWMVIFDREKPPHALQTLEVSISAAEGMDLRAMVNWKAATALLGGGAQ